MDRARRSVGAAKVCKSVPEGPPVEKVSAMNGIIYIVGLVVVVLAVASFFGLS